MTCIDCSQDIPRAAVIAEDIRRDGTLPVYGTCAGCRKGRGSERGISGVSRLSAPERALYGREIFRRAVVVARA